MNTWVKQLRDFGIVLVIAVVLEISVFNYKTLAVMLNKSIVKDAVYTISEIETTNWVTEGNGLLSLPDPQLVLYDVNEYIYNIRLDFSAKQDIRNIYILYANEDYPEFGTNYVVTEGVQKTPLYLNIKDHVTDLRIDLGDDAGIMLNSFKLTVNPTAWNISFSRIIAVLLIYCVGTLLFNLQKTPNYNLKKSGE